MEITADNLTKAEWNWSCASAVDSQGRALWIADAHRDDRKRFAARRPAAQLPFSRCRLVTASLRLLMENFAFLLV
jgi:hypothetical protein